MNIKKRARTILQNKLKKYKLTKNKLNQNTLNKNRNESKNKSKIKKKILNGGVFLGQGSYGCVVKPAIPCINDKYIKNIKNNKTKTKMDMQLSKSVSKILISPSKNDQDEFIISDKLRQIDKTNQHFVTFDTSCRIKQIPSNRSNTVSVEYDDYSLESYDLMDDKKHDKEYCPIDLRLKPINIIIPYGGYDLSTIIDIKNNKNNSHHFTLSRNMLIKNFDLCLKNLLMGLLKMHNIRIVHRDIKDENVMVNYNENTKTVDARFIDFGLSTFIKPSYYKDYTKINIQGTKGFLSPELLIAYYINDRDQYDNIYNLIYKDIKLTFPSLNDYNLTNKINILINNLYIKIKKEFENKQIFNKYFGVDNKDGKFDGYLQKGDIFGLGITVCKFIKSFNKKNKSNILQNQKLHNLIKNMIQPDPDLRYNVIQCLKDPYFENT